MSINNSLQSTSLNGNLTSSVERQRGGQEFRALADAIKSGNLSNAQSAYQALQTKFADLQKNQPNAPQPSAQDKANFDALGKALASGDISAAQTAFQTIQKSHGKHHHHAKADNDGDDKTAANNSSAVSGLGGATLNVSA